MHHQTYSERAGAREGWRLRLRALTLNDTLMFLIFLIPLVGVLLVTNIIPLAFAGYLAVTDWQLADRGASASWVGFENFKNVLTDTVFQESFLVSAVYAGSATAVQLILGTLVAYMVVGEGWPMRIARAVIIIPMFIPGVVVGTIWRIMFHVKAGLANYGLGVLGIPPQPWFSSADTALWSIVLVDIWYATPFVVVLVVAGISSLSADPIRAAMVDGASRWQTFRYVMLPLLAPVIVVAVMFRFLLSFFVLDHVFTTTFGGPGFTTNLMSFHLYRQGLSFFNLSYAAAASWLMIAFAVLVILTLIGARRALERRASA